jgi:hypothetical protein
MEDARKSSWLSTAVVLLAAVCVAYVIFSLAKENRELKAQLREYQASPLEVSMKAGEPVPEVDMIDLEGNRATLRSLVEQGGVMAFLTTTCPYCRETLPDWKALAGAYTERGVPFFFVSLHDGALTATYAQDQGIEWPMWVTADPYAVSELRVDSVPFTVLVEPGAIVREVRLGPLTNSDIGRLEEALDGVLSTAGEVSRLPDADPDCCSAPASGAGSGR